VLKIGEGLRPLFRERELGPHLLGEDMAGSPSNTKSPGLTPWAENWGERSRSMTDYPLSIGSRYGVDSVRSC